MSDLPKQGYAIITNEWGVTQEMDTISCVHCQRVMHIRPGSGKQRGFCFLCHGPTCGMKECLENCTPFEKKIEAAERRHQLHKAIERNFGV